MRISLGKSWTDGCKSFRKSTGLTDLHALALLNIEMGPLTPAEFAGRVNIREEDADAIFADLEKEGLISEMGGFGEGGLSGPAPVIRR